MVTKAKFIILDGNQAGQEFPVLFNPAEYQISESNTYASQQVLGASLPIKQYISGETSTLTFELFFDTTIERTDVRQLVKPFVAALQIDSDLHQPPRCCFAWGKLSFKGIVVSIESRFTMFLSSGIPVRATLQVTFHQLESLTTQFKKRPHQSADRTKQQLIHEGETLAQLAAEHYNDATQWRALATANGIEDPRLMPKGRTITIPRWE